MLISNVGDAPADVSYWHVFGSKDAAGGKDDFVFPGNFILEPGQIVTLHSGDDGIDNPATDFYWIGEPVWNNQGETVFLEDRDGNLIDSFRY